MIKKNILFTLLFFTNAIAWAESCDPSIWNMPLRFTEIKDGRVSCNYSAGDGSIPEPNHNGHAISYLYGVSNPGKGKWSAWEGGLVCVQQYPLSQYGWEQCTVV